MLTPDLCRHSGLAPFLVARRIRSRASARVCEISRPLSQRHLGLSFVVAQTVSQFADSCNNPPCIHWLQIDASASSSASHADKTRRDLWCAFCLCFGESRTGFHRYCKNLRLTHRLGYNEAKTRCRWDNGAKSRRTRAEALERIRRATRRGAIGNGEKVTDVSMRRNRSQANGQGLQNTQNRVIADDQPSPDEGFLF